MRVLSPLALKSCGGSQIIDFREKTLQERADKVFGNQTFGGSLDLHQDHCEDRSLFSCVSSPPPCKPSQSDSFESLRAMEEEEDENLDSKPLTAC